MEQYEGLHTNVLSLAPIIHKLVQIQLNAVMLNLHVFPALGDLTLPTQRQVALLILIHSIIAIIIFLPQQLVK